MTEKQNQTRNILGAVRLSIDAAADVEEVYATAWTVDEAAQFATLIQKLSEARSLCHAIIEAK